MRGFYTTVLPALFAATGALADAPETIERECLAQLNMPPGACACLGRTAGEELSQDEQAFVVAMILKDDAASAELRARMPLDQLTRAAMFMTSAPARCARP